MKWTLINPAGTNDPDTGDIYSGLDRFGRVKDHRWLDGAGTDLDRLQYGYDRAGNRIWRRNVVAAALGKEFDELYGYDGIHRLQHMARGTLNGGRTALTSETFAQCWTLDSTGNWQGFREDDDGNGTWDLIQQRSANAVNEISGITETAGPSWVTPAYSRAGNMTTLPQPADPTQSYTATYDAWNRLVKLADGADTVSKYAYDGANRRIVQKSYTGGVLDETRHLYYTQPSKWQVIEERVGTAPDSVDAERQFVWGKRYIDDLILRDHDPDDNGSLDERLHALQDANWNVIAITDNDGEAQERYAYSAYGVALSLSATFVPQPDVFNWETLYCGYRLTKADLLYQIRRRAYASMLGIWLQRDPVTYITSANMQLFVVANPLRYADAFGLAPAMPPDWIVDPIDLIFGPPDGKLPEPPVPPPKVTPPLPCTIHIYGGHNFDCLKDISDLGKPSPYQYIGAVGCACNANQNLTFNGGPAVGPLDDILQKAYPCNVITGMATFPGLLTFPQGDDAMLNALKKAQDFAKSLCDRKLPGKCPKPDCSQVTIEVHCSSEDMKKVLAESPNPLAKKLCDLGKNASGPLQSSFNCY